MKKKVLGRTIGIIAASYFCLGVIAIATGNNKELDIFVKNNVEVCAILAIISAVIFKWAICLKFWSHDFLVDFKRDLGVELATIANFIFLAMILGWESNIAVTLKILALMYGGLVLGSVIAFLNLRLMKKRGLMQ